MALYPQKTAKEHYEGTDKSTYQFVSLEDIINDFTVAYIGDDKIIRHASRQEVNYHAYRSLAELSYDTLKRSVRTQELEIPPSLSVPFPHDYVGLVKMSFINDSGIEFNIRKANITSDPRPILQDQNYNYLYDSDEKLLIGDESDTRSKFKAASIGDTKKDSNIDFLEEGYGYNVDYGKRYGIDPTNANKNGSFTINEDTGTFGFSSDIKNKTIIIKYVTDNLYSDAEAQVHKFAEEAVYKSIAYGIMAAKQGIPEYQINRVKKEKKAAVRAAKLRLSDFSPNDLLHHLRGKSKQIKH